MFCTHYVIPKEVCCCCCCCLWLYSKDGVLSTDKFSPWDIATVRINTVTQCPVETKTDIHTHDVKFIVTAGIRRPWSTTLLSPNCPTTLSTHARTENCLSQQSEAITGTSLRAVTVHSASTLSATGNNPFNNDGRLLLHICWVELVSQPVQ